MALVSRSVRTGALLGAIACIASCAAQPGYQSVAGDTCDFVQPQTIDKLVGHTVPKPGHQPPEPQVESAEKYSCAWDALPEAQPAGRSFASAYLSLEIQRYQSAAGSPDVGAATRAAEVERQSRRMRRTTPQFSLGDESAETYQEEPVSSAQTSYFYLRKSNVDILVTYGGLSWGAITGNHQLVPQEQLEQDVHDVAAEALNKLGSPR